MVTDNPFRPGFGVSPPLLAGRRPLLDAFAQVFGGAVWSEYRAALISGLRGVGKTVLLNAIEDLAREHRWIVISGTLRPGFVSGLERDRLPALLQELDPDAVQRDLTGGGIQGVATITTSIRERYPREYQFASYLRRLVELAEQRGAGVLISLDEVARASFDDLRTIAVAVQELLREHARVAIVAAGLPAAAQSALDADGLTFFRRAAQINLDTLRYDETLIALGEPIRVAGRKIETRTLERAAQASLGYPFLVQSIGAHAWEATVEAEWITDRDVDVALPIAQQAMESSVIVPGLRGLSERDRDYLAAMASDDDNSETAKIALRLGVTVNYANQYRARLLNAGAIVAVSHGRVDFAMPGMREYLRRHSAMQALGAPTAARSTFPQKTAPPEQGRSEA